MLAKGAAQVAGSCQGSWARQTGVLVHIDEQALQSSLQRLREAAFDADLGGVLKRAVNAVDRVFGCTGAGIMFMTGAMQTFSYWLLETFPNLGKLG